MTDPTSHQRGHPTETRQQLSENNLLTESNIWSQVWEWARYLHILTDWLTVSCNVASTSVLKKKREREYLLKARSANTHCYTTTGKHETVFEQLSQSHWQSVSQSVSMSWCRAHFVDVWPDIASFSRVWVWNLLSCLCEAPSPTRGRVCPL
jgi:predicted ABC-class ATPase